MIKARSNSPNAPRICASILPAAERISTGLLAVTTRGSHCGFYEGAQGRNSWAERVMAEFLSACARQDRGGESVAS